MLADILALRMIHRLVHKTREISRETKRELFSLNRFRRLAAMWGTPAPCVYDWSKWNGTLIKNIVPRATRIRAKFEENPRELAARLASDERMLLVHLDISDNTPFIADPVEFVGTLAERGVRVLNGQVRDIRKRTVQACCANFGLPTVSPASTGDADELLIVKTDLNSAGSREQRLTAEQRARFKLPARGSRLKGREGYFVARRGEMSSEIWNDHDLVIERFMHNPAGRLFRVYAMLNSVVISEGYVKAQIKRIGDSDPRINHWLWRAGEVIQPCCGSDSKLPGALLRTMGIFINRFHLDFGAIDVVESAEGDFYIVDVNKTPFWDDEVQPGLLEHLRLGFQSDAKPSCD
jgi:hypothetical protein